MNFDFNTVALVGLSLFSLYFGYSYFKARFEDRMRAYTQRIDEVQTWIERENERIVDRIYRMENRISDMRSSNDCKSKYPADKNYYNSEV